MVHSGYHPLKHCPLRLVLAWCTVDIITLSIVLLSLYSDGAQWISSSKHRPFRLVLGWCTVDIILLSIVLLGWYLHGAQWISSP